MGLSLKSRGMVYAIQSHRFEIEEERQAVVFGARDFRESSFEAHEKEFAINEDSTLPKSWFSSDHVDLLPG